MKLGSELSYLCSGECLLEKMNDNKSSHILHIAGFSSNDTRKVQNPEYSIKLELLKHITPHASVKFFLVEVDVPPAIFKRRHSGAQN